MLALAQTQSFDACQALPSITNLLSADCDEYTKAKALTEADLAYLRGVYKAGPDSNFNQQRRVIAGEMARSLLGH